MIQISSMMTYFLSILSIKTALELLSKAEIAFVLISMKHRKQYFFRCRDRFIEIVMWYENISDENLENTHFRAEIDNATVCQEIQTHSIFDPFLNWWNLYTPV
jgi:hypothetical protein